MASSQSLTVDKVDLVVNAVADKILQDAGRVEVRAEALASAFRDFAEGVALLTVPPESVRGSAEEKTE